jgi:cytochrome oxidase assembly protein ShyY1
VLALLVRPKFWPGHLAMVMCVAIAVGLGLWQLDAWSQHRADAARDLARDPAVPLSSVMSGDSTFPGRSLGRPVSFSGTWLTEDTVYVSDREHHGHRGYWVVTPVLVSGTQSAMPVVRGWSSKTDATAPSGPVEVTGWLEPTEGSSDIDPDPQDDVIPAMRIASLVELVDADLYSGYVVARDLSTGDSSLAAVAPASSPGVSAFTGLRNLLYAIEWWVFGAFALFIWARWCQDSLRDARPSDPVGAA